MQRIKEIIYTCFVVGPDPELVGRLRLQLLDGEPPCRRL